MTKANAETKKVWKEFERISIFYKPIQKENNLIDLIDEMMWDLDYEIPQEKVERLVKEWA